MSQQTFDPSAMIVNVLGVTLVQLAKGQMIVVAYDSDAYVDEVGANGDVVRVRSADLRATIKVTLMKASPSNDYLSGLAAKDRLTGGGHGPSFVKDPRGTSRHFAAESWVKKIPEAPYATESSNVEWEIRCAALLPPDHVIGGTLSL